MRRCTGGRLLAVGALLTVSLVALSGPTGCVTRSCSAVGYADNYDTNVSVTFKQPPPTGQYVIDVTTDSESVTLSCPIPGTAGCCSGLSATTVGACPVREAGAFSGFKVTIGEHTSEVTLQVSRDGTLLGSRTFKPRVVTDEPNGKGCGFRHFVAPETLAL